MKKMPTLFMRNPDNMGLVTSEVNPECQWVLDGEGIATRKYDGTCVLIENYGDHFLAYARREVKPGKAPPDNWLEVDRDEVTGKRMGWEPISQSGWNKFFEEAVESREVWPSATYELCGPKINGNPEKFDKHVLVEHGLVMLPFAPRTFNDLQGYIGLHSFEGIVWHHPDGRRAKLKRSNFGYK